MPPEMNEQGIRIKPNNKLSEIDKAFIAINYPFPSTSTLPAEANPDGKLDAAQYFKNALGIAGVAGTTYTTLVDFYEKDDWEQVRYTFSDWCLTTRIAGRPAQGTNPAQGVNPADEPPLPEGFMDGCLTEFLTADSGAGASKGVATDNFFLWTPGAQVTFAFLQGDTVATTYRKGRVRETFDTYTARANLQLVEVPWNIHTPSDIRFFFGDIPIKNRTGWSYIGQRSVRLTRTAKDIAKYGGNTYSSIVISPTVFPATGLPTSSEATKREEKALYHEIGHALGLDHEHQSPHTLTKDTPTNETSVATFYDPESVMLYPGRELRSATVWQQVKDYFDPKTTKYTYLPSAMDLAFLGVSRFHAYASFSPVHCASLPGHLPLFLWTSQ
jgi:hypothetical protein